MGRLEGCINKNIKSFLYPLSLKLGFSNEKADSKMERVFMWPGSFPYRSSYLFSLLHLKVGEKCVVRLT